MSSSSARIATIANDSPFCESRQSMKKLEDDLTSPEAMNAPLDEIERMLRTQGREMLRVMMQTHFDQRAAQECPVDVRGVDGIERTEIRRGSRKVETEFGEVELQRNLYRAPGVERLAPLDVTMQLPTEKYSYELRRMVAEESAKSAKRTGANVPKRQVEELVVRAAQDFDLFYRDRLREVEETDHLMVLSFDGKGIAMRLEDLREATRKKAEVARADVNFDLKVNPTKGVSVRVEGNASDRAFGVRILDRAHPAAKKAIKAALDGAPVYRNVNMKEEQALNRLRKDENLTYILAKPVNQGTVFGDVAHEQATGATVDANKAIKAAKSMKAPPPESSAEATLIGYKGQLNAGVGHFPTSADELRAEVFDKNLKSTATNAITGDLHQENFFGEMSDAEFERQVKQHNKEYIGYPGGFEINRNSKKERETYREEWADQSERKEPIPLMIAEFQALCANVAETPAT